MCSKLHSCDPSCEEKITTRQLRRHIIYQSAIIAGRSGRILQRLSLPKPFPWRSLPGLKPAHCTLLIAAACLASSCGAVSAEEEAKWNPVSQAPDLTVYERMRKDSVLREFKAVGLIAMPPEVVRRVLDDVDEYPRFMPYVTESRVLARDSKSRVSYQRVSPPLVGDRDYTIRVQCETLRLPGGAECYFNRWQTANDLGPTDKAGVTRVTLTEGSWLLEPTTDGRQTRATYCIYSDSGGSLPAYIVNAASKTAIPKLFEAVRKQAQLKKYSAAR